MHGAQFSTHHPFAFSPCCYCCPAHSPRTHSHTRTQLDNLPSGDNIIDIQDALYEVTGARSVPRVFIGGKFIGGGDDTAAKAASGELKQLLAAQGLTKA
jgi:glutaredoxin 3